MLTSSLHAKWITRFFLLVYLLLALSTANASFWCQDEKSSFHLESNPIGKCWTNDHLNTDATQQTVPTQSTVFSSEPGEDCIDSPVYSSALTSSHRTNSLNRVHATAFDTINIPHIPALSLKVTRYANLSRPARLPAPQTLKALRTVVLLH